MKRSWNLFRKTNTTEVQHRATHIPTLDKWHRWSNKSELKKSFPKMIRQRTSCSEVSRTSQCLPLCSEINSRVMKFKAISIQTISCSKLNVLNIPRRMQLKFKDSTIRVLLCSYSVHYKAINYKLVDEERGYWQNQNPVKVFLRWAWWCMPLGSRGRWISVSLSQPSLYSKVWSSQGYTVRSCLNKIK